jgi:serine/alanine adding enzyme
VIEVVRVGGNQSNAWDQYISYRGDTTFVDRFCWSWMAGMVYNLPVYNYLARTTRGVTAGILSLVHTRHPLLGNYLATAPFANWGGYYADTPEAHEALIGQASLLRHELHADYLVLRLRGADQPAPPGWQVDRSRSWYMLELKPDPEASLAGFGQNLRSKVRRSLKQGFSARWGGSELAGEFHACMLHCMRELGSPYHKVEYIHSLLSTFGQDARIVLVDAPGKKAIGAGMVIQVRDGAVLYHGNILKAHRSGYAGNFLYFTILATLGAEGLRWLDMGRSLSGSGNEAFKMEWRPQKHELVEWYDMDTGGTLPGLNQQNPKFRLAQLIWRRLPLPIAGSIGPQLIWGLL